MAKKKHIPTAPKASPTLAAAQDGRPYQPYQLWLIPLAAVGFFLLTCLTVNDTIKATAMLLVIAAVVSTIAGFGRLRERITVPMLAISAWVVINGASTFYALSGKFALREFLKLLVGFCLFWLILIWAKSAEHPGRTAASMLVGGTTIASLVSIDLLSTHWISTPVVALLKIFSDDFAAIAAEPVEVGVRMSSLYENPNVFAGAAGLAVLLALGLAISSETTLQRCFHLVCLFINALAFILAFSMGATATIAVAFLVYLVAERRNKGPLLMLMLETLVLALLCAFPIFLTSFSAWDGFQPVPLLCVIAGSAALCGLDLYVGRRVGQLLQKRIWILAAAVAGILALLVAFALIAINLTGSQAMPAGSTLRRAEYPKPGAYALSCATAEAAPDDALSVTIESQNQEETMMHTSTVLYSGPAQNAQFTVGEDALVVYFNFASATDLHLDAAIFSGPGGDYSLKLGYRLLPGFIVNRLQGLFANENAIQRTVFFADGLALFRRSPVFGLGMGAFESALRSVQSFNYETKYTHNHYIETLIHVGVVGLILFLAALLAAAFALVKNLLRKDGSDLLAPALAAALVFMMGHAAVEVIFSFSFYLPLAFGVLALICVCCGSELPLPGMDTVKSVLAGTLAALMVIFAVFLGMNMQMRDSLTAGNYTNFYDALKTAASLDRFERFDYMLSYINNARTLNQDNNKAIYQQAKKFADELATKDSNTIPPYLAEFYFATGERELGYAMLYKYVDYLPAVNECWQTTFSLLQGYDDGSDAHKAQVKAFYELFQKWNDEHMGTVTLTQENLMYVGPIANTVS